MNCTNEMVSYLADRIDYNDTSAEYNYNLQVVIHSEEFREKFVHLGIGEMALVYTFALVFLVAIGGNLLVCFAVLRNEHMQTVTNYYIVNLAISDILMITLCMPATVMDDFLSSWYFGSLGCKLIPYFQVNIFHFGLTSTVISIMQNGCR